MSNEQYPGEYEDEFADNGNEAENSTPDVPVAQTANADKRPARPGQRELVFCVDAKKTKAEPLTVVFADGAKTLPGWLVDNVGGTEMLTSEGARVQLLTITYDDFMAHWGEQHTRAVIGKQVNQLKLKALNPIFRVRP
jgi:hypothetical protein